MAIHPNFVDNNMRLERIFSIKVKSMDYEKGRCEVVIDKYADLNFNVIMWKNLSPEDEKYKEYLKQDFAYDQEFNFNIQK